MLRALIARFRQGHRTLAYPGGEVALPERFRGLPSLDPSRCPEGCAACLEACPTGAVRHEGGRLSVDMGRCLFCPECERACPAGALRFTGDHRLAARRREDLLAAGPPPPLAAALGRESLRLFGRSLKLRQVSAGGCNACEADVNVLGTPAWDVGRFGIAFVASPRHADGLLVTGPVTANMRTALLETYAAVPAPKLVIAVGACALSGGPFAGSAPAGTGLPEELPVDLYVPGCPPHPLTTLDGLLRLLGRLGEDGRRAPAAGPAAAIGDRR